MMKKLRFTLPFLLGILFMFTAFIPLHSVYGDELSGDFTVEANAAISVDADTGKIFYSQNSDTPLGIASITKIISLYLVEKEVAEGNLAWEDEVVISEYLANLSVNPELSNVPLVENESYTVKELFDSSVIQSSNSSIMALAEKIAGSENAFVDQMNELLTGWGIEDAKIINSSGLTNKYLGDNYYQETTAEDENELSAKDVAIIARHLINDYPDILAVSSTPTQEFGSETSSPVTMSNSNWMLSGMPNEKAGVDGLKTGTTDYAGPCFVGTIEKEGQRIITVVLGTNDEDDLGARFTETSQLMDYSFENWHRETILSADEQLPNLQTLPVYLGEKDVVPISIELELSTWMHTNMSKEDLTYEIDLDSSMLIEGDLPAPVKENTIVGTVQLTSFDTLGYLEESDLQEAMQLENIQVNLKTNQAVEELTGIERYWRISKDWLSETWTKTKEITIFSWHFIKNVALFTWDSLITWFTSFSN